MCTSLLWATSPSILIFFRFFFRHFSSTIAATRLAIPRAQKLQLCLLKCHLGDHTPENRLSIAIRHVHLLFCGGELVKSVRAVSLAGCTLCHQRRVATRQFKVDFKLTPSQRGPTRQPSTITLQHLTALEVASVLKCNATLSVRSGV